MELLQSYFINGGLFKGPPDLTNPTEYISNSGLAEIKRVLLSEPPFLGDEIHLVFGGEAHKRNLENKKTMELQPELEDKLNGMQKVFRNHKFIKAALKGAKIELTALGKIANANVKIIVDIDNKKTGFDYKTSSAKTEKQFIDLAIKKYDYLRQSWIYKQVMNYDDFYFIGQQKKEPYSIFILNVKDHAKEERKTIKETKFLIEIYKHFGRAIIKSAQDS